MKEKEQKLQHVKNLLNIVNDEKIKQTAKEKAWLELWAHLELSVAKIANKTISKYYQHNRPSGDLVRNAIDESKLWIIKNSKNWDPKRGTAPATWAFKKIAQLTMKIIGMDNETLEIDEDTEEGATKKKVLEKKLRETSPGGLRVGPDYIGESEDEHPFDILANLNDPCVSLLLEALQYLLGKGLINDDGATICAERVMGTAYSIIAKEFGKTEEAVRRTAYRVNQQLKKLNLEMPRYADLIKIRMIADVVNSKDHGKGDKKVTSPK